MLGESMILEACRRESFGKGVALKSGFLIAAILIKSKVDERELIQKPD
jgi:hypothetical protein